jgi:hypothetical protein
MRLTGGLLTCFAILLAAGSVEAQAKPPAQSSTQFTLRRGEAAGSDAQAARARARAGDCAGALPSFDAAIRVTIDATLRRDRGLCHEKLNHPYPAIEDYRAYLLARPEAADGDQIRQRLAALEEQVGIGGAAPPPKGDGSAAGIDASASGSTSGTSASGSANASVSLGGSSSSSSGRSHVIGPKAGEPERSYDYYAKEEKLHDTAEESPLRRGSGAILGAVILPYRTMLLGDSAAGGTYAGYALAGTLRYSFGANITLMGEIGYAGYGTAGRGGVGAGGGLITLLGLEARIPVSKFAADLILLGGGVGYERLSQSFFLLGGVGSAAGIDLARNGLAARGRFGYRHVFGPSFGIDILFEPGFVNFFERDGIGSASGLSFGLGLALLIGGEGGT